MSTPWNEDIRQKLETLARVGCEIRYDTNPYPETETPYSVEVLFEGKRLARVSAQDLNTAAAFAYLDAVDGLRELGKVFETGS